MLVCDVHHDAPLTILFLPDANVTAALVSRLVRPVRVTEISGTRYIGGDWLPFNLLCRLRQLRDCGFTPDKGKTVHAIKSHFRRGIREIRHRRSLLQHFRGILSIAIQQRFASTRYVNGLERFLRARVGWRPQRLWST